MAISRPTPYVHRNHNSPASVPKLIPHGLYDQQHQCIKNLSHVLEEAGTDITQVVKVNVFLANMDDFAEMNSVYMQYWGDVKPCRT